jgi:serine/threonine-protein kinase
MKRCTKCYRLETDDSLDFCRADGTRLVDYSSASESSGTLLLHDDPRSARLFTPPLPDAPSIAVLAFADMSPDADHEYFCDGLAEEILNALAKVPGLKVAARTSAFSFKGRSANVGEIGQVLGVKTLLEGSVRKAGNRLRVTVQLINVADGYHLWSERYDRELRDVFDVQDEITSAVVAALKVELLGAEKAAVLKRYTGDTEAYELYLKGRHHLHQHTAEGWVTAREFFEQAVEKEPRYAPAYAGLASVLAFSWFFSVLPPEETVAGMKAAASRALEIDDQMDEAHAAMARVHFYYEWDWAGAEREYLRAIELNPNNAEPHHQYGIFLACMERREEAVGEGRKALELDPLSLLVNLQVGWTLVITGRLDEAIELDRRVIEIEPTFHGSYWQMGFALVAKGMYEEALESYRKAMELGGYQHALSGYGAACAYLGRRVEAAEALNELLQMRGRQPVSPFNIARVYSSLGDADKAIEWLEEAFEERNGEMVFLSVETKVGTGDIFGKGIRRDPRFQDLVRRVGLPQ